MDERILGSEKISRLFIKYTIPAVFSMVLAGSQIMIDGMFVGNFVGSNALASVNIVLPFVEISMAVSFVITFGTLSIIGRNLGAGNIQNAQNTFKTATYLIAIFSVVYGLTGIFGAQSIGRMLGADVSLLEGVSTYLRTYSCFLGFYPLMILTGFADRIIGKPQLYLYATITTLVVNISLDYILIKEFGIGIKGAAIATGISYLVGLLITIKPMLNKKHTINLFAGKYDPSTIRPMLYNGASEGIGAGAAALAVYLFNLEFMKRVGPEGVAAFTMISYVVRLGMHVIFGIADGISPIVSYNYGHEKYKRVKAVMRCALVSGAVIGSIVFIVLILGGNALANMFSKGNTSVVQIAATGSVIYAFAFLVNSYNIIYSIYYTAIGNAKDSAILAIIKTLIYVVIGLMVLPKIFGDSGVWMVFAFSEVMTLITYNILIKRREYKFIEKALLE